METNPPNRTRHLISIDDLDADDIERLLDASDGFAELLERD